MPRLRHRTVKVDDHRARSSTAPVRRVPTIWKVAAYPWTFTSYANFRNVSSMSISLMPMNGTMSPPTP